MFLASHMANQYPITFHLMCIFCNKNELEVEDIELFVPNLIENGHRTCMFRTEISQTTIPLESKHRFSHSRKKVRAYRETRAFRQRASNFLLSII